MKIGNTVSSMGLGLCILGLNSCKPPSPHEQVIDKVKIKGESVEFLYQGIRRKISIITKPEGDILRHQSQNIMKKENPIIWTDSNGNGHVEGNEVSNRARHDEILRISRESIRLLNDGVVDHLIFNEDE